MKLDVPREEPVRKMEADQRGHCQVCGYVCIVCLCVHVRYSLFVWHISVGVCAGVQRKETTDAEE